MSCSKSLGSRIGFLVLNSAFGSGADKEPEGGPGCASLMFLDASSRAFLALNE